MKLNDHDLQQLDADWLHKRSREELLYVSEKLLADLRAYTNSNALKLLKLISKSVFVTH